MVEPAHTLGQRLAEAAAAAKPPTPGAADLAARIAQRGLRGGRLPLLSGAGDGAPAGLSADLSAQLQRSQGQPLPDALQRPLAGYFGADLSGVEVHADEVAARVARTLGARAFTLGEDIYFGSGQFAPHTAGGYGLIGHEVAHVVQGYRGLLPSGRVGSGTIQQLEAFAERAERQLRRFAGEMPASSVIHRIEVEGELGDQRRTAEELVREAARQAERILDQRGIAPFPTLLPLIEVELDLDPRRARAGEVKRLAERIVRAVAQRLDPTAGDALDAGSLGTPPELLLRSVAEDRAKNVYDAFFNNDWLGYSEDEEKALAQIRGQSPGVIGAIRDEYHARYSRWIEDDFQRYCSAGQFKEAFALIASSMSLVKRMEAWSYTFHDDEEQILQCVRDASSSERAAAVGEKRFWELLSELDAKRFREALVLMWPHMTVVHRLRIHVATFSENEEGMLDVLRTASRSELDAAANSSEIEKLLGYLDDDQGYEARKLLRPTQTWENVLWRLKAAHGTFNDDEKAVYNAILELSPAERRKLWEERAQHLSFLSSSELSSVERMCGSELGLLDERLKLATAGAGTDDPGAQRAVAYFKQLLAEERSLRALLDAGQTPDGRVLSAAERRIHAARLAELVQVRVALLTAQRDASGDLKGDTFLGRLQGDLSDEEFNDIAQQLKLDPYEAAKQQLLQAIGLFNDDEEAIYKAIRGLRAQIKFPAGKGPGDYSRSELARMQEAADRELRHRLLGDPDLQQVWTALNGAESAAVYTYVSADAYAIALEELERAYGIPLRQSTHGRFHDDSLGDMFYAIDRPRILGILAAMSEEDRKRLQAERPLIFNELTWASLWLSQEEKELIKQVIVSGRLPTQQALQWAMGGSLDGTNEEVLTRALQSMSEQERAHYRLGYWLHERVARGGPLPANPAELAALRAFRSLRERLASELSSSALQTALDDLIGVPTTLELDLAGAMSQSELRRVVDILYFRQQERLATSGGLADSLTYTDETTGQAAVQFERHYLRARDAMTAQDLAVLVALDKQFTARYDEYESSVNVVAEVASTIGAVVAGVVVVVVSGGTMAPAVIAAAAALGGGAKVGLKKAMAGGHYDLTSGDAAVDLGAGAIEGAMAVLAAGLATRAAGLVGLGGRQLSAQVTKAALETSQSAVRISGRSIARGGLEAAIDGVLSGAAGEVFITATNVETWKRSMWDAIGQMGLAALRGGLIGGTTGLVTGGTLEGISAIRRVRGIRALEGAIEWTDSAGGRVYPIKQNGRIVGARLQLGRQMSLDDITRHVDEALLLKSYGGISGRLKRLLTGVDPESDAYEVSREIAKHQGMIEDRLARLNGRGVPRDEAEKLMGEIQLLERRLSEFQQMMVSGRLRTKGYIASEELDKVVGDAWDDFTPADHAEFKAALEEFRSSGDLMPTPKLRGGEGVLFTSPDHANQALKRWFADRKGDMAESIRRLQAAEQAVGSSPAVSRQVEVVKIHSQGSDWIRRDFDPNSLPLEEAVGRSSAARQARQQAIAAIEAQRKANTTAAIQRMRAEGRKGMKLSQAYTPQEAAQNQALGEILKRLRKEPASDNLHWSADLGKILVIDLQ